MKTDNDKTPETNADTGADYVNNTEWFDHESLMSFDRANDPYCLIGNRWLCRGSSLIIQGPTGIGKSSLILQMLMSWSLGRDFFGLKPKRPLRIVLIQAENDKGDLSEPYQDIMNRALVLDDVERAIVKKNLKIGRNSTDTGPDAFPKLIRETNREGTLDIIVADPLLTYAGGNVSEQENMTMFLRHCLQPIMNETGVIIGFLHHTGKPAKEGEARTGSKAYNGFGSSEIPNWAREVMSIEGGGENDDGEYTIHFCKRGEHAGLADSKGNRTNALILKHADDGGIYWRKSAESSNVKEAEANRVRTKLRRLHAHIVKQVTVSLTELRKIASQVGHVRADFSKEYLYKVETQTSDFDQPLYAYLKSGSTNSGLVLSIRPCETQGNFEGIHSKN